MYIFYHRVHPHWVIVGPVVAVGIDHGLGGQTLLASDHGNLLNMLGLENENKNVSHYFLNSFLMRKMYFSPGEAWPGSWRDSGPGSSQTPPCSSARS